jgi:hypothetical protein
MAVCDYLGNLFNPPAGILPAMPRGNFLFRFFPGCGTIAAKRLVVPAQQSAVRFGSETL